MEPAGILLLIVFPVGPIALGVFAWWSCRGQQSLAPLSGSPFWPGVVNSSLAFAVAFNLVYFVQEFFLAWPKSLLPGVEAVVYHNNHNWSGDHPDVLLYQGAGAVAIIVLGALMAFAGAALGQRLKRFYSLYWWFTCLALGLGLIQILVAAMHPDNDVGQAFEFLELSSSTRLALALAGALSLIWFGIYFSKTLLSQAAPGEVASPGSRTIYILKFAILPLFIGTLLAWPHRAPPMGHLTMPLFSGLCVLPWTLAAAALTRRTEPISTPLHTNIDGFLVLLYLVTLAWFRWILAPGMNV